LPKPLAGGGGNNEAKDLARTSRLSRTPADSDKDYLADSELDYVIPGARLIGRLSQIAPLRAFLISWATLLYPAKRSPPARVAAFKQDHRVWFWVFFALDLIVQLILIALILAIVIGVVLKTLA
jgi:hypothetical protein